jgi:hypothetical protein
MNISDLIHFLQQIEKDYPRAVVVCNDSEGMVIRQPLGIFEGHCCNIQFTPKAEAEDGGPKDLEGQPLVEINV